MAGFRSMMATQPNARLHFWATVLVLGFGELAKLSRVEWCLIVLAIAMVWTAEALNTALEVLADEITLERRPRIKIAKDVAAFAVLVAAIAAATIGSLVFVPHFAAWLAHPSPLSP